MKKHTYLTLLSLLAIFTAAQCEELSQNSSHPSDSLEGELKGRPGGKKYNPKDEKKIYLNFENAELTNFVNYIAELNGLNIIPDKALEGNKISLTTREPLTLKQAFQIYNTILDQAGFSMVKVGKVHKIVSNEARSLEPLLAYINVAADDIPENNTTIRYVKLLENVKATEFIPVLKSMLSATAKVIPQNDINAIIITDSSLLIKSAARILEELDQSGPKEALYIVHLKEADAADVEDLFKQLNPPQKSKSPLARMLQKNKTDPSSYFSPDTKIIALERTNALVLLGREDAIERIVSFIENHVDKNIKDVESPLHVFELQYADATQIQKVLQAATQLPPSQAGQTAASFGAVRGGVKYFQPMTIQADPIGNRLIVTTADKEDWELLRKTIKNLDKPQPQVAVETLIVTVDINENDSFGGQMRPKKPGSWGNDFAFQSNPINQTIFETMTNECMFPQTDPISLLGNLLCGLSGSVGQTLLTFGRGTNIWAIFEMLERETHASLVAQPFLSVANNYQANIVVGETRRILAQTTQNEGGGSLLGFRDADANLELQIKPQINIEGVIILDILTKLEQFTEPDGDSASAGNTINRSLSTQASIADGQVLILGGLVQNRTNELTSKTPFFGDIPGIGWLFKNKVKVKVKQNLLIFMCPTIIKPRQEPGVNLYTKMKLDQSKNDIDLAEIGCSPCEPIYNWLFNCEDKNYRHKVEDFENARYQPSTVDIKHDSYYRGTVKGKVTRALSDSDIQLTPEQKEMRKVLNLADTKPQGPSLKRRRKKQMA